MERYGVEDIIRHYRSLSGGDSWRVDEIVNSSHRTDYTVDLPVLALNNGLSGPSLWIFAGIHGEEPAGPNMLVRHWSELSKGLTSIPTLILPLCNPYGYLMNQRYLVPSSSNKAGISIGDPDHLLLDATMHAPIKEKPTSPEAAWLMDYLLRESLLRPPLVSLDLHEDALESEGYVYSQGGIGIKDKYARAVLESMRSYVPIKRQGETRFGEHIEEGLVGPVHDLSVDEFIAAEHIYLQGKVVPGIHAKTVLVVETPASGNSLEDRVFAQLAAVRAIIYKMSDGA